MKRWINFARSNREVFIWSIALIWLFFMSPVEGSFSICPVHNLGFDWCPGCGLGRSVHYAMWLDFTTSFQQHPLGIVALVIIIYRIITLIIKSFKFNTYEHKSLTSYSRR
jgi:hypothetical protein